MTQPAWLARAVLYQIDMPRFAETNGGLDGVRAHLDYCADLGVNALALARCFTPLQDSTVRIDPSYGNDATFDALIDAAHARGIRVCIATASRWPARAAEAVHDAAGSTADVGPRDAWQRAIEAWFDRGVDAVLVDGAGDAGSRDPSHVALHRLWRDLRAWVDATYRDRAVLMAVGHPPIVRDAGFDVDIAQPNDAFGGDTLVTGPNPFAAVRSIGRAAQPCDPADLKVLFTYLLTWPHAPCICFGDEVGAVARTPTIAELGGKREPLWHHVERLIYLRVTEADLAPNATCTLLGGGHGQAFVYRRGATLIIALNSGLATRHVALPRVGDAAPVLEHHCHAAHGVDGWELKIGARGYGVFTVR